MEQGGRKGPQDTFMKLEAGHRATTGMKRKEKKKKYKPESTWPR